MTIETLPTELSKQEIKNLIDREEPIILDIGAFDCSDSKELVELYNDYHARLFAFEPIYWEQKKINRQFVTFFDFAIGDIDGFKHCYFPGSNHYQSCSLCPPQNHLQVFPEMKFHKTETRPTPIFRLDTWYKAQFLNADPVIDFIWCDVNGSEGDVIKGATETLKRTRYLYVEFSDKELYEGQLNKEQLMEMLPDWGLLGIYNYKGNFGNLLLKNKTI